MINRLIFILAFVWAALTVAAQVNVSGIVVEEGSNEPLTGETSNSICDSIALFAYAVGFHRNFFEHA